MDKATAADIAGGPLPQRLRPGATTQNLVTGSDIGARREGDRSLKSIPLWQQRGGNGTDRTEDGQEEEEEEAVAAGPSGAALQAPVQDHT